MGILEKFFPAKTVVTSAIILAEITERESEIKRLQAEIGPKLAAIATMADAEHQAAEVDVAANKRAIERLDARIAHLQSELPAIIEAEEATAKAAADAALRARAEACRKANEKEAAKLLAAYDEHASAIGGIIAKLKAMDGEREAINAELRANPVCETVASYVDIHRTTPGTEATE
jgi:DNA repair exonuclease SbcCD ATPase subunit